MTFCSTCHRNITGTISKHRKFCLTRSQDQSGVDESVIESQHDQAAQEYLVRDTAVPGGTRVHDAVSRNFRVNGIITTGQCLQSPSSDDFHEFDYGEDAPVVPALVYNDDQELLEEGYFEWDSDADVGEQAAPNHIIRENGLKVIDVSDLPTPSNRDYWNIRLASIVQKGKVSRSTHEEFISFCNDWKQSNSNQLELLDSVHVATKRLTEAFPVNCEMYDVCRKGCMLFNDSNQLECSHCFLPRFKDNDSERPFAKMRYLPLAELLGSMLATPSYRDMFRETFERNQPDALTDIFDGYAFADQAHLFQNEFDVALALYVDGFSPFKYGQNSISMTIIHLVVLNLPKEQRYKLDNMLQIGVIPGPSKPKDIHSFLAPLLEELKLLSTEGVVLRIDGERDIHMHAHLLLASGDIPGVADLIHHSGHGSHYGCRSCRIESSSLLSPQGAGTGQYFPGNRGNLDEQRTDDDFTGQLPNFGISSRNPFTELPTHHSPFFYGMDELHLIGQNIARQILSMLKGQYANADSPFILSPREQQAIGKAIKASHLMLPLGLDGDLGDIFARSKSSRGVDLIDFLLYVVPTVVHERLEANGCIFLKELASLVNACSIALKWEISYMPDAPEYRGGSESPCDVDRLQSYVDEWHTFMYDHIPHNLYTINMHYLRHLPHIVKTLGPPRSYSARSMERAIGEIKAYIKSRVSPGANASNALLKIAALQHQKRKLVTSDTTRRNTEVFSLGENEDDPEFWGTIRRNQHVGLYQRDYNLQFYIKKYWSRATNTEVTNIDPVLQEVAPKLYKDGNEYDCLIFSNNRMKKMAYFVTAMLPVDLNAHNVTATSIIVKRRFFCEIVLFFTHSYQESKRMLCLLKVVENVRQNSVGSAYGSVIHGTRRYVTEVENIEGFAGMIESSLYPGNGYYIYPGMDLGNMKLGDSYESL